MSTGSTRRRFLAGTFAAPLIAAGCASADDKKGDEKKEDKEEEVSPTEDLMREHGVLNRLLLVYEEGARRLERGEDPKVAVLSDAMRIVRRFIEDYHEKLEEDHVFPRFEKAGKLVDLVKVLRAQHAAGRTVSTEIERLAREGAKAKDDATALAGRLHAFVRMYRPHEAREDTVLFPLFHSLVPGREWDELGERFEDEEHRLFGKEGFEGVVLEVGELEKKYGLDDLASFTPR